MEMKDVIQNEVYEPTHEEIISYMNEPIQQLWKDMNAFIQSKYKSTLKIDFSKCSGKPGWNVKHKKSSKSLCTLYPEKDAFTVLVVLKTDLIPMIEAMTEEIDSKIMDMIKTSKPFNGTLWLMIPVDNVKILNNVKQLLLLKHSA